MVGKVNACFGGVRLLVEMGRCGSELQFPTKGSSPLQAIMLGPPSTGAGERQDSASENPERSEQGSQDFLR